LQEEQNVEKASVERLLALRREGRVEVVKTDTVDTERIDGVVEAGATRRILETAGIVELHGPGVLGHSRGDHSVYASHEDDTRIDRLLAALFPGSDRYATDRTSSHNLRDAMHIATAVRYGCGVFVTTDERLLKRSGVMQDGWNIQAMLPSESVRWVEHLIEKERIRSERRSPG
jgi:hypothetical protein